VGACQSKAGPGSCCTNNGTKGCLDAAVESCVCAKDPLCCSASWDASCASEVQTFGCGACP
jgi:hypothetical protein